MFDGFWQPSSLTSAARLELDPLDRINRGLLGFWPLKIAGGSVAEDISPNNRRLTITNTYPTGYGVDAICPHGRAMNFSGYTHASARGEISSRVISFSAWVRSGITGSPGWNRLVSTKSYYDTTQGWEITLVAGSNTKLYATGSGSANVQIDVVDNWAAGKWHHIVVIYKSNTAYMYAGGILKGSGSITEITSTSVPLMFGNDTDFNEAAWNGGISSARLYNRELTYSEIRRLHREPFAGAVDPAGRLFFAMRGGSGATVYNETINDSTTGAESNTATVAFVGAVVDSTTGAESNTATVAFVGSVADSSAGGESNAASLSVIDSFTDTAVGNESLLGSVLLALVLSDTGTVGESFTAAVLFGMPLSSPITVAEAFGVTASFVDVVTSSGLLADSFIGGLSLSFTISDSATLGDAFADALSARGGFVIMSVTATIGRFVLLADGPAAQIINVTETQSRT